MPNAPYLKYTTAQLTSHILKCTINDMT